MYPLSIGGTSFTFRLDGKQDANANVYYAGTRFFETMGIGMLRGREFDRQADRDGDTAMINERMAKQLFGDSDTLGRYISAENALSESSASPRNAKSRTLGRRSGQLRVSVPRSQA